MLHSVVQILGQHTYSTPEMVCVARVSRPFFFLEKEKVLDQRVFILKFGCTQVYEVQNEAHC